MAMTAASDPENHAYQYTSGPLLNSLPAILWQATGKLMMVLPDHDMVVVSLGETQGTQAQILALWDAIEMFLPS